MRHLGENRQEMAGTRPAMTMGVGRDDVGGPKSTFMAFPAPRIGAALQPGTLTRRAAARPPLPQGGRGGRVVGRFHSA